MITTRKASDISSPITAHRVFLLHLESMRLLGEDNRCNFQSQKKSRTKEARSWRSGARSLGKTVLLLAALIAASVICARAQSAMGSILGTEQDASGAVLNHTNFALPATQIDNTATFGVLTLRRPRRMRATEPGRWRSGWTFKKQRSGNRA